MQLQSVSHQSKRDHLLVADGSIATGGTAQLVLPVNQTRSLLKIQNTSTGPLWFEFGSARATCALSSGAVSTSFTITNAGFNFTKPPVIEFIGGGYAGNTSYLGLNQYGGESPNSTIKAGRPAKAHAVLTGGAVSSIVLDDPGAGYVIAPFMLIYNSDLDPYGCAVPSAGVGMLLPAGSPPVLYNGTSCPTDSVSVFGATISQTFLCRWMP